MNQITKNKRGVKEMKEITINEMKSMKFDYTKTPISFDIETTSTEIGEQKFGFMYIWQLAIGDSMCFGRRWEEFFILLDSLVEINKPTEKEMMIIFVHNLSYEFQFIRKWMNITSYLCSDLRTPIACKTDKNIEFRCSYLLSGVSLEKVSSQIRDDKRRVKKAVGFLDYDKVRNSATTLTKNELEYCKKDVEVMNAYLYQEIEDNGTVKNIPYTKTGKVRRLIRQSCLYVNGKRNQSYIQLMRRSRLTLETYKMWRHAYVGGWTGANPKKIGYIIKDVHHVDLGSSYPTTILSEKFPMGKGFKIVIKNIEDLERLMKKYILVFAVQFIGLKSKNENASYLSFSKQLDKDKDKMNRVKDNGKVVECEKYSTITTSIDWEIIKKCYTWNEIRFGKCYAYYCDYLPKELIEVVLSLYENKTALKHSTDKAEYNLAKTLINSVYGAMVQDPCKMPIEYEDIDKTQEERRKTDEEKDSITKELLDEYNNSRNRWSFYPWGVCVSAYARRNLWTSILSTGNDFIYADTDSNFYTGDHEEFFKKYNEVIKKKVAHCLTFYGIDTERMHPQNYNGEPEQIGIFDREDDLKEFKTLGAKRYVMEDESETFSITIAGVNKKTGASYLKDHGKFDSFKEGLKIDKENSGRLISSYIDEPASFLITDYQGNTCEQHEKSFIHLSKSEFNLSIEEEFKNFLEGLNPDPLYRYVL